MRAALDEGDASVLDNRPLQTLPVQELNSNERQQEHGLNTKLLVLILVRLSGPRQERGDVLGQLGGAGISAILILEHIVVDLLAHTNLTTIEVRVVAHAGLNLNAGRGLLVTSQQREDIILSRARLDNEGKINGVGSVVGNTGGLFVGVGRGNVISELTGAIEHISFVVGAILNLNIGGNSLHLLLCVGNIDQITVGDELRFKIGVIIKNMKTRDLRDRRTFREWQEAQTFW